MAWVTLRQLLDDAADRGYALPAFNVNSLEQCQAIIAAAKKADAPAILQATGVTRSYFHDVMLIHVVQAAVEIDPGVPICLHLDHGSSVEDCASAIEHGFPSVMMDGSLQEDCRTPSSFEYNRRVTRAVAVTAHARGVSVEGALGLVGSLQSCIGEPEDGHGAVGKVSRTRMLTKPAEAVKLVDETGIDALAVAIGNTHGAHKFSRRPDDQDLALGLVEEIHKRMPNVHLVLHGGSALPQEVQEKIARHGGIAPGAWGMPLDVVQGMIKFGVRKINIDTDVRLAMTGAVREALDQHRAEYDPRVYLGAAREAMTAMCVERFEAFGAAGQGSRIRPIPLATMAKRYKVGDLQQTVLHA